MISEICRIRCSFKSQRMIRLSYVRQHVICSVKAGVEPVRLLGIRTSKLVEENAPEQLTIFDIEFPKEPDEKHKKLNAALEQLNNRYGKDAVVKGTFYKPDGKKKKDGI